MKRPLEILLVEDNADHAELAQLVLEDTGIKMRLHTLDDGAKALRYLRREGNYAGAHLPDLVLLDLYLPGMNGIELLEEIAKDKGLKGVRFILLSSRDVEEEERRLIDQNAAFTFLKK